MIVNLIHSIAININNALIMISTAAIIPSVNELSVLNREYVIEGPFEVSSMTRIDFQIHLFYLHQLAEFNKIFAFSKIPFILSKSS